MKKLVLMALLAVAFASCQKEEITVGENVSETFYLENNGAAMRCLVEGNTASKTFLVFVHGGPGLSSFFYNTDYISSTIEKNFAAVYWDQRNTGASQGTGNAENLSLSQITDDLKKLIQLIKHRYGQDASVFVLGHSFGGLVTASFITSGSNQSMIDGWIVTGGSHNYPLNDALTREMLLNVGQQQVAAGNHVSEWQEIISFCNTHTSNLSFEESNKLNGYATDAETYISSVPEVDVMEHILQYSVADNWPITSVFFNQRYTSSADFNEDLANVEFSSKLSAVNTPTLLIYGQYDFICPSGLGQDIFDNISTSEKQMAISAISGHTVMFQDEAFFCDQITTFMNEYRSP